MENKQDYYNVLEIQKDATADDIKKSYKKMAKKWHPDMHGGSDDAKKKFQKISEAYEILSDPKKRKIYDEYGEDGLKETGEMPDFDPMQLFSQMMGQMGMQNSNDVPDVYTSIKLTLEQLYTGETVQESMDRHSLCDKCNGTGGVNGSDISCKKCKGQGSAVKAIAPGMYTQVPCKDCKGTGTDKSAKKCSKCDGVKFFKETVTMSVNVPKGAYVKYPIVLKNEGNQIPPEEIGHNDNNRSNAVFIVIEEPHDTFTRGIAIPEKHKIDYADLMVELAIPFADSIHGFKKNITHLDGKTYTIEHNEPCRYGDILVITGKGMPVLKSKNKYGDLFIKLNVEHPKDINLSPEIKEHIYKKITKEQKTPKSKQTEQYEDPISWIPFDEYKLSAKINSESNALKEEYMRRNAHNGHNSDDENEIPKEFRQSTMQCQHQ